MWAGISACQNDTRFRVVNTQLDIFSGKINNHQDYFVQKSTAKIDILWVIDNSPSMVEEQENIADNLSSFVGQLTNAKVDFQMGVISTDMDDPEHSGKLLGSPQIITSQDDVVTLFSQNVKVGTSGTGREQGFWAAMAALSDRQAATQLVRDDAHLAVIFVSDEDDRSFGEVAYYRRFFGQLKGVGNENQVRLVALVDDYPNGSCAQFSRRYIELVMALRGKVISICDDDFSIVLEQVGFDLAGLKRKFWLSSTNIQCQDILQVTVDGQTVAEHSLTGWSLDQNQIAFLGEFIPAAGSTIVVEYQVPQREFVLSHYPEFSAGFEERDISVHSYTADSASCTTDADCPEAVTCGLAKRCGPQKINFNTPMGWNLEIRQAGEEKQAAIVFDGSWMPPAGSLLQVVYECLDGCLVQKP
jgi:hypothetical protein